MRLLIFLHGTTIMHKGGENCLRKERVKQVQLQEPSVKDYGSYIPIGNAPQKIKTWADQGAEIAYLSSNKNPTDLKKDELVLKKYQFPKGEIFSRRGEETYADVVVRVMPDIIIEDDCESIGGEKEMTFPHIGSRLQKNICSVVVPEFEGIDMLPNDITALADNHWLC